MSLHRLLAHPGAGLVARLYAETWVRQHRNTNFCAALNLAAIKNWEAITSGAQQGGQERTRRILLYSRDDGLENTSSADSDSFALYDPDDLATSKLQPGDIVIATKLASRGTDVLLEDSVVEGGGLHVILTHLPPSGRVERQVFGRGGVLGTGKIG